MVDSPKLDVPSIKGVLLDIDGTMYDQSQLRNRMLREIVKENIKKPIYLLVLLKWLYIFRKERETLRFSNINCHPLITRQYSLIHEKYRVDEEFIKKIVDEWVLTKPLPFLHLYVKTGLSAFLEYCSEKSIRIGVYSDYPTQKKIQALGCTKYCELFLESTSPEINAFKPSPNGLLLACRIWDIDPAQLLYIGDRPEVDTLAARNVGCQFVLMGNAQNKTYHCASDFKELTNLFNIHHT